MSSTHKEYHYSVTIHTDDLALLDCLRALSQHAQSSGNARIPWGGTKREDWQRRSHHATFHFSSTSYREEFLRQSRRLLPQDLWRLTAQRDDDPAKPQTA
jgi:hypothetical protein